MRIKPSQLAELVKIPVGYHEVKIVQIDDNEILEGENKIEYIDVIFHGSQGFISSKFYNNNEEIERFIKLFNVSGIDTPINYSLDTCLLIHRELIIKVDEVEDLDGNIYFEITDFFMSKYINSSHQYVLPDHIEYFSSTNNEFCSDLRNTELHSPLSDEFLSI